MQLLNKRFYWISFFVFVLILLSFAGLSQKKNTLLAEDLAVDSTTTPVDNTFSTSTTVTSPVVYGGDSTSTPSPTPVDTPTPTPVVDDTASTTDATTTPAAVVSTPAPTPTPVPTITPTVTAPVTVSQSAPVVKNIYSPILKGTFHSGIIPIIVVFNKSVTVSGKPQLIISTGAPATTAVDLKYAIGNQLYFLYHILPGNSASPLDYASASAISLNGGSITDASGNNADTTLPEPGSQGSLSQTSHIIIGN